MESKIAENLILNVMNSDNEDEFCLMIGDTHNFSSHWLNRKYLRPTLNYIKALKEEGK